MKLNGLQRKIVWGAVILFAVMGLFPPWRDGHAAEGYAPIFLPPSGATVDFGRLFLQWFMLIVVVAAAVLLMKKPLSPPDQERTRNLAPPPDEAPPTTGLYHWFVAWLCEGRDWRTDWGVKQLEEWRASESPAPQPPDQSPPTIEEKQETTAPPAPELPAPLMSKVTAPASCGPSGDSRPVVVQPAFSTSPFLPMRREWLIKVGDLECGPYTPEELQEKAKVGEIGPDTLVRRAGKPWSKAADFLFLGEHFSSAPDQKLTPAESGAPEVNSHPAIPLSAMSAFWEGMPQSLTSRRESAALLSTPNQAQAEVPKRTAAHRQPAADRRGRRIRSIREGSGLSPKEFAERIGVSEETVAQWECGELCPTIKEAAKIKALEKHQSDSALAGIDG